jgi:hypothetical protein
MIEKEFHAQMIRGSSAFTCSGREPKSTSAPAPTFKPNSGKSMIEDEKYYTIIAMERFGGSFVKALGHALRCADMFNTVRIVMAWPEYMTEYGPGSKFYEAVKKMEAE